MSGDAVPEPMRGRPGWVLHNGCDAAVWASDRLHSPWAAAWGRGVSGHYRHGSTPDEAMVEARFPKRVRDLFLKTINQ